MLDLTPVINGIIALAAAVLTAVCIPWLRVRTDGEQRRRLMEWAQIAVAAAQQLYHQADGQTRKAYALSFLQEKGYDIREQEVVDAMEAAVLQLHHSLQSP